MGYVQLSLFTAIRTAKRGFLMVALPVGPSSRCYDLTQNSACAAGRSCRVLHLLASHPLLPETHHTNGRVIG